METRVSKKTPFQNLLDATGGRADIAMMLDCTLDVVGYAAALWDAMKDGADVTEEFKELGQSLSRFDAATGLKSTRERP